MKILQLIDSLDAGGAERMAVNLANGLINVVDASHLCVTRKEGILKQSINDLNYYLFLEKTGKFDIKAISSLISYVKKNEIDIIHAHSTSFFMATIVKRFVPELKIVWHDHYGKSEELHQRDFKVLKFFSKSFTHIISVNEQLKTWATKTLHCKKVTYLENFALPDNHKPETSLHGKNDFRMICLANLRPQKDHFNLIRAFKKVSVTHDLWTLHLVGKDFEDTYSDEIKSLINELKLEEKVYIYGSRPDVNNILSQCKIGVLSSKSEGLPLALLEYGLANLAVISTNVGDCKKVISDDTLGLLIEPNNSDILAQAINKFIEDDSYRQVCAVQLNQHILTNFSQQKYIERVLDIYKEMMA
ncbi:MAG: glycosyltransferase [Winogradskyella sp.]|nr:glycosyltransferase [Winogradskyella sp.]